MNHQPPIPHETLRELFEFLDAAAQRGVACDHTLRLAKQFTESRRLPAEPLLDWLRANGGGCDCEIMFNVSAQWGEIVGYTPPDED